MSPIDLRPDHLATVRTILKSYVPGREVRVYGSRAKWSAHDNSDLDLVVLGNVRLDTVVLGSIHSAFEESDLPFRVDIFDWNTLPENFHTEIERAYSVVATESTCPGWSEYSIREYAPLNYGRALPSRSRNVDGEYPVYGSNGIIGYHDEAVTEGPAVIIGRKGTAGTVHFSPIPCWPIDTTFYHEEEDTELALFKSYVLSTLGLDRMNSDSAVPGLNRDVAHAMRIRIPPTGEQRRIADVLGGLDDRIELSRRMSGTLEDLASTLFKAWFVDFEPVRAKIEGRWREGESLPGFPAHLYDLFPDDLVDSELGPIPAGWRPCSLGDVIRIHDSRRVPLSKRERQQRKGPFRYYGATGIVDYVDDFLFDGRFVLVAEDGTVVNDDGAPVVQYVWGRFWVNNHAHVLSSAGGISTEHLQLLLRSVNIRPFVTGAVQLKLNQRNLKSIPILTSSDRTVTAFEDIVAPQFAALRQAHDELHLLVALRDLLLPKLISGEVRLPVAT